MDSLFLIMHIFAYAFSHGWRTVDTVLDNVAFARAHNSEQQMDLLKMASAMMSEDR